MYEIPTANVVTGLEVKASAPKPSTHAPRFPFVTTTRIVITK
jgi:hypothetical protein